MLFPERMVLNEIACDPAVFQDIIDLLRASGSAEIEKSSALTGQRISTRNDHDHGINEIRELKSRLERAMDLLDASYSSEYHVSIPFADTVRYAVKISEQVVEIEETFTGLSSIEMDIRNEKRRADFISWMNASGIDISLCRSSERLEVTCGIVTGYHQPFNEDELSDIAILSSRMRDMTYIAVAAPPRNPVSEKLRKDPDFTAVDCSSPPRDIGSLEIIRNGLENVIHSYAAAVPDLQKAHDACESYLSAAEQITRCADTLYCSHIACWVPEQSADELVDELHERFGDRCATRRIKAETAIAESRFTYRSVPSRLVHSRILEPFRILVTSYSWPVYGHIDPTAVSAAFFLVFFGVMFADIGHGSVILAIGAILRIVSSGKTLRNAGMLMMYSGIAAITGGFLFGSLFGREDIIGPLLFSPSEHIGSFLATGIAIGVIVLSAGIAFNTIQIVRNRGLSEALFSQWGLLSLIFYWICVWIIAASFSATIPGPSVPAVILIVAVPLVIMTAGDLITQSLRGHADVPEIAFRPVEIALGLLSNTVSFVRIAAFGLCHIALMNAVYIIASSQPGSSAYFITVSVEGNILVIILESLIVAIQCVRLQFYEFYSKFFADGGRRFIPIGSTPDSGENQ